MTPKEWIAASGIILALIGAGISFGQMRSELADARREIEGLRADMRGLQYFIRELALLQSGTP